LVAFEAPGVEPAFATPEAKRKAIDYACGRFGGGSGEVRIYGDDSATVERSIVIDGRGQYPQSAGKRSLAADKNFQISLTSFPGFSRSLLNTGSGSGADVQPGGFHPSFRPALAGKFPGERKDP